MNQHNLPIKFDIKFYEDKIEFTIILVWKDKNKTL